MPGQTVYHVNPATGKPGRCDARVRACPHGGPSEHFSSEAEARGAYEARNSTFSQPLRKTNPGLTAFHALGRAREAFAEVAKERRQAGPSPSPELMQRYEEKRAAVKQCETVLRSLPWTDDDGPSYSDEPIPFASSSWRRGVRRGYENDLDKLGPNEHKAYEDLDRACTVWLSRLSTAEIKALSAYVHDSQSYAESMAESNGAAATFVTGFKYLHSALEKAPRVEKPIVVYAGISRERVSGLRAQFATGEITLNRVQSTSLNPAMVNNFMRPSDYDGDDHTAIEVQTDRVASLSLFQLREEMEILLPPQKYDIVGTDRNVTYSYNDGYTYEPANLVLRLKPKDLS